MGQAPSALQVRAPLLAQSCCSMNYCNNQGEMDMQRAETYDLDQSSHRHQQQQSSVLGGRRSPHEPHQSMEITGEKRHNVHLVKHIRATSSKNSSVCGLGDLEIKARIKELEKIAQYSPLLKLRVGTPPLSR